jgi:intracellular proteinase inhibitor BsuPI
LEAPAHVRQGAPVPLVFTVTNTSKVEVTLQLLGRTPTADFRVYDSGGRMIWSRLRGQVLLGPLRLYPLPAGKNLSFREVWNQRSDEGAMAVSASYTIVAVLLTDEPNGLASAPARVSIE